MAHVPSMTQGTDPSVLAIGNNPGDKITCLGLLLCKYGYNNGLYKQHHRK